MPLRHATLRTFPFGPPPHRGHFAPETEECVIRVTRQKVMILKVSVKPSVFNSKKDLSKESARGRGSRIVSRAGFRDNDPLSFA